MSLPVASAIYRTAVSKAHQHFPAELIECDCNNRGGSIHNSTRPGGSGGGGGAAFIN